MSETIFDAIKRLETKLIAINNNVPLSTNTAKLNNALSDLTFVNTALLPDSFSSEPQEGVATPQQLQDYSSQVLQAVFNIANSSKGGYVSAITGGSTIDKSFGFLDRTWVPKIVDDRTYAVGKALQEFLAEALSDDMLKQVPETVNVLVKTIQVREPAKQLLQDLKIILDKRLAVYELHSKPEKVKKSVEYLKIVAERRTLFLEKERPLTSINDTIQRRFPELMSIINKALPTEPKALEEHLKTLEAAREELDTLSKNIQVEKEKFNEFIQQWKADNDQMELPKRIQTSSFINALASGKAETIAEEWGRLFNDDNVSYEIYEKRIGDELERYFNSVDAMNRDANSWVSIIADVTDENTGQFSQQISDAHLLKNYIEQLQAFDIKLLNIDKPRVLGGEFPGISLNIELSTKEIIDEKLSADLESHRTAIKELEAYKQQLLERKQQLDTYQENNPLPDEAKESPNRGLFTTACTERQQQLRAEMDSRIEAVNGLITTTTLDMKRLDRELIKLNRGDALGAASIRIDETAKESNSAQMKLDEVNLEHQSFMDQYAQETLAITQQYAPKLDAVATTISETQKALEDGQGSIDILTENIKKREGFLKSAKEQLEQFKKVLDEHQGLYIPSEKIPQKNLMKYLECGDSKSLVDFFNEIYKKEQAGNAWYGMNSTRLSDMWNHRTSMFGPSDFDSDLSETLDYIEKKIQLIDKELAGKLEKGERSTLPENNLSVLQTFLNNITQTKNENEERLVQLRGEQELLNTEQNEQLNDWNQKKAASEQALTNAQLKTQFSQLASNQAVFASDVLELGYALADIEDGVTSYGKDLQDFAHLDNEELIAKAGDMEGQLKAIRDSINSEPVSEQSINDLLQRMEALEKQWGAVSALANNELHEEFNELKAQMSASLEEKGLSATSKALVAKIADKQQALDLLIELAKIQIEGNALLEKATSIAGYTPDQRWELYEEIQKHQDQVEARMAAINDSPNELVKEKYTETNSMFQDLTKAKNTIVDLEALAEINYIYSEYIKRIDACTPEMVLERRKLLKEINAFAKGELADSLSRIKTNGNSFVQEEIKPLIDMHKIIKSFRKGVYSKPVSAQNEMEKDGQHVLDRATDSEISTVSEQSAVKSDAAYILEHLNKVIYGYKILAQRCDTFSETNPVQKQALYNDILDFEASELVRAISEVSEKDGAEINNKLNEISVLSNKLAPFKENYNRQEVENDIERYNVSSALGNKYFGEGAIFNNYLQERAQTFWFKDCVSSIAACVLGCFGYKTEAQEREEYLEELKTTLQQYQKEPFGEDNEISNRESLLNEINRGIELFAPRSKLGEEGYDKTLKAKLTNLRDDVNHSHEQLNVLRAIERDEVTAYANP